MAYCRGDVYAYYDGLGWSIQVGGHPDDGGKGYYEKTPEDFRARLLQLRAEGHEVPQHAIDRIEREIAEGKFKAP